MSDEQLDLYISDHFQNKINVFHSAMAVFFAPSDPSGIGGMRREHIRSSPSWRCEGERRDCILVSNHSDDGKADSFEVARVMLFFSFKFRHKTFSCALVQWFPRVGDNLPDYDTGMWIVQPESLPGGRPELQVIHTDTIIRSAHLLPLFGPEKVHPAMNHTDTLQWFRLFYLNKWADHHTFNLLHSLSM